jgi:hypothetical protein
MLLYNEIFSKASIIRSKVFDPIEQPISLEITKYVLFKTTVPQNCQKSHNLKTNPFNQPFERTPGNVSLTAF